MKRLRQIARWRPRLPIAAWIAVLVIASFAVLAAFIFVLPKMLVPDRPAGSLKDVTDAAKKLELEDARLKERNDVRVALLSNRNCSGPLAVPRSVGCGSISGTR